MKLDPVFYIPTLNRPLVQTGKPGAYEFIEGSEEQHTLVLNNLVESYKTAWNNYEFMLKRNIAKEVARMCLPVAIYSTAYVTCNPRSIMNFLSLRTKHDGSRFPSYPQWEINQVANQMETLFGEKFPITHAAFNNSGRVCP
jgi:thymidylate synthase (FAD)